MNHDVNLNISINLESQPKQDSVAEARLREARKKCDDLNHAIRELGSCYAEAVAATFEGIELDNLKDADGTISSDKLQQAFLARIQELKSTKKVRDPLVDQLDSVQYFTERVPRNRKGNIDSEALALALKDLEALYQIILTPIQMNMIGVAADKLQQEAIRELTAVKEIADSFKDSHSSICRTALAPIMLAVTGKDIGNCDPEFAIKLIIDTYNRKINSTSSIPDGAFIADLADAIGDEEERDWSVLLGKVKEMRSGGSLSVSVKKFRESVQKLSKVLQSGQSDPSEGSTEREPMPRSWTLGITPDVASDILRCKLRGDAPVDIRREYGIALYEWEKIDDLVRSAYRRIINLPLEDHPARVAHYLRLWKSRASIPQREEKAS